ncbi:hypothetical protein D3C85_1129500 [compost metagenome]|jgi:hypothetical protein
MKSLAVILMLIVLSGCVSSEWFPKGYSSELAYKCQINPHDADCFQAPPVFQGPK